MKFSFKIKLSVTMVLQFMATGAVIPVFSLYLKDYLNFGGLQTGIIIAMSSVASFVSPIATSFIADKIISAEKLFTVCQLIGAAAIGLLAFQRNYYIVLILFLFYSLITGPTVALINAIFFHSSSRKESRKYGFLRVWGTIGWIVVAWIFYFWLDRYPERIQDTLIFSSISTFVLGFFSLTFPEEKNRIKSEKFIPIETIRLIARPEIIFLLLYGFLVNLIIRYFYYGASPFLESIGFANKYIMPAMSLGQISEILAMLITGFLIKKFGYRLVLIFGLFMELLRSAALFVGSPVIFVLSGLFVHGFSYTFYFVPSIILLDSYCNKMTRTDLHQLSTMFTLGFGRLAGNLIAGVVMDYVTVNNVVDYQKFWLVPIIITMVSFILPVFFIKPKDRYEAQYNTSGLDNYE